MLKLVFLFGIVTSHDGAHEGEEGAIEAVPTADPCDDGIKGAEIDLPIACRDPASWETCGNWTCDLGTVSNLAYLDIN